MIEAKITNEIEVRPSIQNLVLISMFFALFSCPSHAQQDDAGLWSSVTVKHQITRRMAASLSEQVRLHQNISDVDQFFTDLGVDYDIKPSLKVSVNYRWMSKNKLTYYSTRHRLYVDLTYKRKFKPVSITLRQRVQSQVESIHSSENGKIPEWYTRTKLTLKLDLNKKYTPYIATEYYYVLDNLKEEDHVFDKSRYEVGVDYDFNRRSSLNLFYLIQKDILENKSRDFVSGIGYTYSF
ncbi:MAG TPA: DUF2490 domain-containing protein [Bacteroidia bacterium]|nr:DUF2490 domain-containing protein [Bacteroidia bacterium]